MKISEFRAGLKDLQAMLSKWGAVKQAKEFESLAAALEEFDDLTFGELARRVKAVSAPAKKVALPKVLNQVAIDRYLGLLNGASHSSDAFDRVVDQAVNDKKQLPNAELKELALQFGGSVPTKGSRPDIAAFLRSRRLEMRRQDGLGSTIDRMFGRS